MKELIFTFLIVALFIVHVCGQASCTLTNCFCTGNTCTLNGTYFVTQPESVTNGDLQILETTKLTIQVPGGSIDVPDGTLVMPAAFDLVSFSTNFYDENNPLTTTILKAKELQLPTLYLPASALFDNSMCVRPYVSFAQAFDTGFNTTIYCMQSMGNNTMTTIPVDNNASLLVPSLWSLLLVVIYTLV